MSGSTSGIHDAAVDRLAGSVRIEPRDYQKRVVARVIEMFSGPHVDRKAELPAARSVMVESPTGSGKTVMGLLLARWAQETLGMRVVWTAMRRNLLAQVERENRDRGFGVELRTVSMFDRHPPPGDLLIVDEAQHDATRSMASLHAAVGSSKVLGLSATPWRADRLGLCFERSVDGRPGAAAGRGHRPQIDRAVPGDEPPLRGHGSSGGAVRRGRGGLAVDRPQRPGRADHGEDAGTAREALAERQQGGHEGRRSIG